MKKCLLLTLLLGAASIAYAGGSCCDKGGEKPEKDASTDKLTESSITLACGSKCGTGDKDKKTDTKDSLREATAQFAGSGCSGDKDGKKCGDKELHVADSVLA